MGSRVACHSPSNDRPSHRTADHAREKDGSNTVFVSTAGRDSHIICRTKTVPVPLYSPTAGKNMCWCLGSRNAEMGVFQRSFGPARLCRFWCALEQAPMQDATARCLALPEVAFWSWGIRRCACRPSSSIHAEPLGSQHPTGREQPCMWMVTGRSPFWLLRGVAIPEENRLRPRHTGTGGIAVLVSELSAVGLSMSRQQPKSPENLWGHSKSRGLGTRLPDSRGQPGISDL